MDPVLKGNEARFFNHSCNPNCYVDGWMWDSWPILLIIAGRTIEAGEELMIDCDLDQQEYISYNRSCSY